MAHQHVDALDARGHAARRDALDLLDIGLFELLEELSGALDSKIDRIAGIVEQLARQAEAKAADPIAQALDRLVGIGPILAVTLRAASMRAAVSWNWACMKSISRSAVRRMCW